jgi:lipid A galacturonosyltransferase RgtD
LFVLPGGLIAIACLPRARLAWRDFCISAAVAIGGSLPNLWWNLNNRMITVTHTQSIAHWGQLNPRLVGGLEFFGAQFGVVGPIVFAAILLAVYRAAKPGSDWRGQLLVCLSVPVIALICFQATIAKAYANWAVTAYVAGTVLSVWTLRCVWPQGLRWSLLLNGAVSGLVALLPVYACQLSAAGAAPALERYLGRSQVSNDAAHLARELLLTDIVSDNRDILADMFFTLRGEGLHLYARAGAGTPKSYYDQKFAAPKELANPVLFVSTRPSTCRSGQQVLARTWQPHSGNYHGKTIYAYRMDPSCLTAE